MKQKIITKKEPELAIDAYETAMRRAPKDHRLAEKIGDAYVRCHFYAKALTFYEAAMKSGRQTALRIRFADQLLQASASQRPMTWSSLFKSNYRHK